MPPQRRTLRFHGFDEVMPDVERLLAGHTTVGNWTLAEILQHLAAVIRLHVDTPANTVYDPSLRRPEADKLRLLQDGVLPTGINAPPAVLPSNPGTDREEAENLRQAIAYYLASSGPASAHRLFGPMTREEWDRLELVHLAHHLSFVVPINQNQNL